MTIAAIAVGAVLTLVGTRLAALPIAAAAALAAASGAPSSAAATWVLATTAGLAVCGTPVRRLVVPLLGVGGVVVAASATNVAGFVPAWTLGTVAAVVATRPADRRWSAALVASDVTVVASASWTVLADGFVSWPPDVASGPGVLLIAGALLRVPLLAALPDRRPESGLLVVRAQAFVLLLSLTGGGVRTSDELDLATVVLSVGAAIVALGGFARRQASRDGLQEAGLVAIAAAASLAGWSPAGWAWGAMAAGTLVHLARAVPSSRSSAAGVVARLVRGGGLGTPFVPVAAALLFAAAGSGGIVGATVLVGVVVGLGGRAWWEPERERRTAPWTAVAFVCAAVAAGLAAPLLARPSPPAGGDAAWPGVTAYAVVALGAALGALLEASIVPGRPRRVPAPPALPSVLAQGGEVPRWAVLIPLAVVVTFSVGIWITGWVRGFL